MTSATDIPSRLAVAFAEVSAYWQKKPSEKTKIIHKYRPLSLGNVEDKSSSSLVAALMTSYRSLLLTTVPGEVNEVKLQDVFDALQPLLHKGLILALTHSLFPPFSLDIPIYFC